MKNLILTLLATACGLMTMAQVGTIENITVEQRTDGSGMVDISFDLMSPDTAQYNISLEASFNGGGAYEPIGSEYFSGDVTAVGPATGLEIVWDGMASHPEVYSEETILKIVATLVGGDDTEVVEVLNPATGKIWMDRNLGATRAATSSTDSLAYGDLYQWGRDADGHQIRTSGTISTLSNSDSPGHGYFILAPDSPYDWRSPQNDNLWQGVNGINNPCPEGYRLPTEAELDAERLSWSSNNADGAFTSPLKLPMAGGRNHSNGSLFAVGLNGLYWTSTNSRFLAFLNDNAFIMHLWRARGLSVRCLKDSGQSTYNVILQSYPDGTGQVIGAGQYPEGTIVNITATPNTGYSFVNWTGDTEYIADANAASTILTMLAQDVNLTANFEEYGGGDDTEVVEVLNPATGKTWMDRNLGASRAAISSTDAEAYGDLYQWGRGRDGHEKRTSNTTTTLSNSDTPGHGDFILGPSSPWDWRVPQNDNLWQGINGINNPCPTGYRLPTEAELNAERESWVTNNADGAFDSPLKLQAAGRRLRGDGSLHDVNLTGTYWSSTTSGVESRMLMITSTNASLAGFTRAPGLSVRCIKDAEQTGYSVTLQVNPEESGTVSGMGQYPQGSQVSIIAMPNTGYLFAYWSGDTAHVANPYAANTILTMPAQNVILVANFEFHDGSDNTEVVEVINPSTGRIWMDRNLGASRAATSSTDTEAYGHLYQWGRSDDGHQFRESGTTTVLSNSDTPGHNNFILVASEPHDWRTPQNDNLWQGLDGINNPCPTGFRPPTEAEFLEELGTWDASNAVGGYNSILKLTLAGGRFGDNGTFFNEGFWGHYWLSNVAGTSSQRFVIGATSAMTLTATRSRGLSVRCIKDSIQNTFGVNLNVNPAGTGQVTGAGQYPEGTAVNITATPNAGYTFVNWTGDTEYIAEANAASTTLSMPAQDVNLTANFLQDGGGDDTEVVDVFNPATGKTWMDRNLGASQAATSSTDSLAYGDLYQWGRADDGHQKRTSGTTSTLSSSDTPGHGDFIIGMSSPWDWRSPQNTNLWQGVNGINNPCPVGYRLPTEAELNAERLSWSSNNAAGAFASPLKLPVAGRRDFFSGSLYNVGSSGIYWSSTVGGSSSNLLFFESSNAATGTASRASGYSIRCIKDSDQSTYNVILQVSPEGSGQVSGAGSYQEGATVNITATSNAGYTFVNWTGDTEYIADAEAASTTLTMPAQDVNLTANFEEYGGGDETEVVEVLNPSTGKTWMDRNLGATRAATSSTDSLAYGDLYQWGRAADGHQKRTSGTTGTQSNSDTPGHGNFITTGFGGDWRSPSNDNLWQGESGINNPCPEGFRIPTIAELNAERLSWASNDAAGAYNGPLKFPAPGYRHTMGDIAGLGDIGYYWSSSVYSLGWGHSRYIIIAPTNADSDSANRGAGMSVRCIKSN